MGITSVGLPLLLVGIPAFAGVYLIVTNFGRAGVSNGVSILIFAIVVSSLLTFYAPESRTTGDSFLLTAPSSLALGAIFGATTGFITRRRRRK